MESEADGMYRALLRSFYPVFFASSLLVQAIVQLLIFRFTPANMAIMKMILANTHICQMIVMMICVGCQFRMISTAIPIELRSYGPLRVLEAYIGYSMHQAMQFFLYMSGMSIIVTFYYKYATIKGAHMSRFLMLKIFLVFHIPVIISAVVEIIMVVNQSLPAEVRQKYALLNANVEDYSVIGVLSLQSIPSRINFILMCGSVFLYPLISFIFRSLILKIVNEHMENVSDIRKRAHRSFVTGLTIQALLPLFFYTPVFALYVYVVFTHEEILFQQYTMYLSIALPAFFDPLITLYFVIPYRVLLKRWLRIRTNQPKVATNTSTVSVVLL